MQNQSESIFVKPKTHLINKEKLSYTLLDFIKDAVVVKLTHKHIIIYTKYLY